MSLCSGMCLPAGVTLLKSASDPYAATTSAPVLPDKPTSAGQLSQIKLTGRSQIRRDVGFDPFKFFGGERKFAPAFEEFARAIPGDGRITAKQDAVHSDLAHSAGQQRGIIFPHACNGNPGNVKIKMPCARISAFDRLHIYVEGLVCSAIIAAAPRKMGDLDRYVRSRREQALEEQARLVRPVRAVVIDIRVGMNNDGHTVRVCCREDRARALHVFIDIEVDVGVTEMKLETGPQIGVFRATFDLADSVIAERVDGAETSQASRILRDLPADPVVLGADVGVLVRAGIPERVGKPVRVGKNDRAVDACRIHLNDQVRGRDGLER